MPKLTLMVGKVFEDNKWGIAFCSPTVGGFSFLCEPCENTKPFHGKVFDDDEISEMIKFLQQTLEEKRSND